MNTIDHLVELSAARQAMLASGKTASARAQTEAYAVWDLMYKAIYGDKNNIGMCEQAAITLGRKIDALSRMPV